MSWARIDDSFPEHPKIERLSDRAWRLHVTALCHCNRNLTDGVLSEIAVRAMCAAIKANRRHVAELAGGGLWGQLTGGWEIHDYLEWNPSAADVRQRKIAAKERMFRARSRARSRERAKERSPNVLEGIGSKELEKEKGVASDVQRVYDHWRQARGKTRANYARISPARRKKITARLAEFSVDELVQAVDAVALDPWPERPNHDDITILFRSREQVEKFLDLSDRPRAGGKHLLGLERALSWVGQVGWDYPDYALWEELGKFDLSPDDKRTVGEYVLKLQTERGVSA